MAVDQARQGEMRRLAALAYSDGRNAAWEAFYQDVETAQAALRPLYRAASRASSDSPPDIGVDYAPQVLDLLNGVRTRLEELRRIAAQQAYITLRQTVGGS